MQPSSGSLVCSSPLRLRCPAFACLAHVRLNQGLEPAGDLIRNGYFRVPREHVHEAGDEVWQTQVSRYVRLGAERAPRCAAPWREDQLRAPQGGSSVQSFDHLLERQQ